MITGICSFTYENETAFGGALLFKSNKITLKTSQIIQGNGNTIMEMKFTEFKNGMNILPKHQREMKDIIALCNRDKEDNGIEND